MFRNRFLANYVQNTKRKESSDIYKLECIFNNAKIVILIDLWDHYCSRL